MQCNGKSKFKKLFHASKLGKFTVFTNLCASEKTSFPTRSGMAAAEVNQ